MYKGKEIIKDNTTTVRKSRNRITARKVLDSAPYIIYRFAEDFGIQDSFISAMNSLTNIRQAGRSCDLTDLMDSENPSFL